MVCLSGGVCFFGEGPVVNSFAELPPYDEAAGVWNVIIETAKGSGNKFKYDEERGLFELACPLPLGAVFPFDFGFLPGTRAEDGDPLDVLFLMDAPAFPGCLVRTRLIGVIESRQTEKDGQKVRNDRLIGVAEKSRIHKGLRALRDLDVNLLDEIEHFFASYNQMHGKRFRPRRRSGPKRAERLAQQAIQQRNEQAEPAAH